MDSERISHYRLVRLLARGGMGEVYEAVDLDLDRPVALKFVAPELTADDESLKRFEREALAAAALNHPHIATLYALDRSTGRPFIAMELLSGQTLRARMREGPMAVTEATEIVRDVASALTFAHRNGIVHRDIKPENLMFDHHDRVKVTDFGLARLTRSSVMTATGAVMGTATYMAPECVRGEAGPPSDVFALGTVLYEMIAGSAPFAGDGPLATLYAIANQEPRPLAEIRPETPPDVTALVGRMLAKDPAERPTAVGVGAALGGAAEMFSTSAITVPLDVTGAVRPAPPAVPGAPSARHSARRFLPLLASVAGLALAAIAVIWWPRIAARGRQEALGLNNRGLEALQRGDRAQARALFEHALRRDPSLGGAMINLGVLHQQEGRVPQAESLFTVALRRFPRDRELSAQARYNLGGLDLDAGAWESAVRNLTESFQLDSSAARTYNNYGLALVRVGRAGDALAVLDRGLQRFPSVGPLHKNAGLALIELGRPAEAIPHLDQALRLDPTLEEARVLRERAEREARPR